MYLKCTMLVIINEDVKGKFIKFIKAFTGTILVALHYYQFFSQ